MTTNFTDRINGVLSSVAIKAPVYVASTGNLTLSGLQTIDGESVAAGKRVLAKDQDDKTENGIYISDSSAWRRSDDFNGNRDVVKGTFVRVTNGSANANKSFGVISSDPITIGLSNIEFSNAILSSGSGISYLQTGTGAEERTVEDKEQDIVCAFDFMTPAQIADARTRTGSIDLRTAIQAAIDSRSGPMGLWFPSGIYMITGVIYLRRTGVRIFGDGAGATGIKFVNAAGGIVFSGDTNTYNSTAQYAKCGIYNLEVLSSDASTDPQIVVDLSSFSYGYFNIQAQTRRANATIYYGQGNAGTAPYFNRIESDGLFGGLDYTQKAFDFQPGAFTGGSNGPNANVIGPISRMAALDIGINLKAGQGNLFHNIIGESLGGAFMVLGGNTANDTGTSTGSNTAFTLKDSGASWDSNAFVNGAVQITGGAGSGQVRRIATNTGTQLNLVDPWASIPDNTSQYSVFELKSADNKFINLRQEGLASLNPDFIYAWPDSANNEVCHTVAQSLGSGNYLVDYSCSPKNKLFGDSKAIIVHTFTTPGAGANVNAYPRSGAIGGLPMAGQYAVEWVKASTSASSHGDTATVTVDCGGGSVGAGSPTFAVGLPDGTDQAAAFPSGARVQKSGTNEGLFLNLTTGASFGAGVSVTVMICVNLLSA